MSHNELNNYIIIDIYQSFYAFTSFFLRINITLI